MKVNNTIFKDYYFCELDNCNELTGIVITQSMTEAVYMYAKNILKVLIYDNYSEALTRALN